MNINKSLSLLTMTAIVLLVGPSVTNIVFAQGAAQPLDQDVTNISGGQIDTAEDVSTALENIAKVMRNALLALAVIFVIVAAYNYLFSGGSEDKVATAHKMLTYAAVAVLVALLAFGFEAIIRDIIGVR